ncbi:TPA: hypothetical protein HA234_03970 [Candidatus Woesearchaeota archaeon]|nr:hypothetical protein [Candidatus Woesearchaeota archaeon]
MRLTKKKVEEIIIGILGPDGLPLLKQLYLKDNISEFELATKVKRDIKVIRKMLYFLYNHNLVSFTRKKDKIKGWYIYYWTLSLDNIKFNYLKRKKDLLNRLTQRLEEEKRELFFTCPNHCVRLNFDQSMDFEFHCPECGQLVLQDSSEDKVQQLKKQVETITAELKELNEVKKVRKTEGKVRKKIVRKKAKKK